LKNNIKEESEHGEGQSQGCKFSGWPILLTIKLQPRAMAGHWDASGEVYSF
jgi:hypothetical protein